MNTTWMGRYRELVAALVLHANVVNKGLSAKYDIGDGIILSVQEWQTMEFLVEHNDANYSMTDVSRALGIPPSSFSRIVKTLKEHKLLERYQVSYNKKNVIIRATEYATTLYDKVDVSNSKAMLEDFFTDLNGLSDEDIKTITNAIINLTKHLPSYDCYKDPELIKIE